MEKHKVGVLSDTHGLLRPEVEELLEGCEWILHAGDINRPEILDKLKETAPVYAVKGNNDKEWAEYLPKTQLLSLYGKNIFLVHNKKEIPKDLEGIDIIIYGHSHKYEEKSVGGQLWLNPGSCGPRRFTQPITMAVLEIWEDGSVIVRRHDIPHQSTVPEVRTGTDGKSRIARKVIESVMKDVDKGKTVKEIAGKNGIPHELAEQICRLYLTHPGVDADGIMTKMGL